MSTAKQNKIDTYAAELTNIAHVSIHHEELLKGIIKCIELYEDRIITKQQLNKEYKHAMKQMKYELKIKQLKVESDYYQEVYKNIKFASPILNKLYIVYISCSSIYHSDVVN